MELLEIALIAFVDCDAGPGSDWFLYTFDERMISVPPALALLRQVSASNELIEEGGMPLRRPEYHGNFAGRVMLKAYVRKRWKRFTDTGKGMTDLPMLDEQDALMAEEEAVVAAE